MHIRLFFTILFSVLALFTNAQRRIETINESWHFHLGNLEDANAPIFEDPSWELVNLPHTWNAEDAFKRNTYYRGIAWYRKDLVSTIRADKKYYLNFEGVLQVAVVYVNGIEAGIHKGGYTAFCIDITALLHKGEDITNQLTVKVDNSYNPSIPPLSADFNFWGGIYRDIYLTEVNPVHFRMDDFGSNGVFIETPDVSEASATVRIRGEIRNDDRQNHPIRIETLFTASDGKLIKKISSRMNVLTGVNTPFEIVSGKLSSPHLWSPEDPYLYRVTTQITDDKTDSILDIVDNPLGFRWFSADVKNGFLLNGKSLKLMGVCRHQDYPGIGNALSNDLNRYDIELIKKMGANYIRICHYPQDPSVLETCDKLGLIAWEEIPVVNEITPGEEFLNTCKTNLIEMIRQHYNHPSIMIWAYSNEVMIKLPPASDSVGYRKYTDALISLHQQLEQVCRKEDPKRLTALAFHGSKIYNNYIGNIPKIVGWNRYDGWYGSQIDKFGVFLDEQNKDYPDRPLIISEYGAGSDARLHSLKPEIFDFSIEYQQIYHQSYLKQILARPYVIGASVWNFIDFGVASREESMPRINNKGLVYYNRQPKDIYYFYQAALSSKPVLHIASSDWIMRNGIPANGKDNFVNQPVKIFTNLPNVELFLNGISLGKHPVNDFVAVYTVPFIHGKNILDVVAAGQRDVLSIDFKIQPYDLPACRDKDLLIAVNAGSNCFFTDPAARVIFEPDQAYRQGSWGYIGGEFNRAKNNRAGIQSDILATTLDPLFQTAREGMEAYRFDVPDGRYEVELFFCEFINPASKNTFYDLDPMETKNSSVRIFSVSINNSIVLPYLDIARQFNPLTAVIKTFTVEVKEGKGIIIGFSAIKGKPVISGLKIERL